MVYVLLVLFSFASAIHAEKPYPKLALTFGGGDRLGDKLKAYIKAKYYAKKTLLPFLCFPFNYADQFYLSKVERFCPKEDYEKFSQILLLDPRNYNPPNRSTLFAVMYHAKDDQFIDNLTDAAFIKQMKKMLSPRDGYKPLTIPEGMISVAVHIRRGGGYDSHLTHEAVAKKDELVLAPNPHKKPSDQVWPKKFLPDSFYIDQVGQLARLSGGKQLYIYLFTDDAQPELLAQKFYDALKLPNVVIDFRKEGNSHDANVVDDLHAMARFDCLIRPDSGLSHIAEFIGDHAVVIKPERAYWNGNMVVVARTALKYNLNCCKQRGFDVHRIKKLPERYYLIAK